MSYYEIMHLTQINITNNFYKTFYKLNEYIFSLFTNKFTKKIIYTYNIIIIIVYRIKNVYI